MVGQSAHGPFESHTQAHLKHTATLQSNTQDTILRKNMFWKTLISYINLTLDLLNADI